MEKHKIPTGYLIVDKYSKGQLETLSIGDYGKSKNIKADFLGHTRRIDGVANQPCLPLQEKWVVTLSTQYGCPQKCTFCDVPNIPFKGNATYGDLVRQMYNAIECFDVKYTDRLNIHFARMGEPIFNRDVFEFSYWLASTGKLEIYKDTGLRIETIHPVLTTSMPKRFKRLQHELMQWCIIKNDEFNGQAGLQLSINSTNDEQRDEMFGGSSLPLEEIAKIAKSLPPPLGRKYCLNFAYSSGFEVIPEKIYRLFNPENFMVKITPIHNNTACDKNGHKTIDGYSSYKPYEKLERAFVDEGFDTIVFIPSMDEENGLVTCGNAVLGGSEFKL